MKKDNQTLQYFINVILPILGYGGISGFAVGMIVTFFRWTAHHLAGISVYVYTFVREKPVFIPALFGGLLVLALAMAFLLKKVPEVKGSGVPRTEGILRGLLSFKWYRLFLCTIIGSGISFVSGLSLGYEGPSLQLGAATAQGTSQLLRGKYAWRRYIATGGAGAGLAVAFGTPITGIMFSIEEGHRQFNPLLLLSTVSAVFFAYLATKISSLFMGDAGLLFAIAGEIKHIPFSSVGYILMLGLFCGITAVCFNNLLLLSHKLDERKPIPLWLRLSAAFLLSGAAGLLLVDTLGGGMIIINKIFALDYSYKMLLILFFVKLILILIGYASKATGGLFIPMLTMGAIVGALCGKLFIVMGMDESFYSTIVTIAMVAFMGACIRTPFTAVILLVEATRPVSGFLSAAVVIFMAFAIAEVCMRRPLYDVLLERELELNYEGKKLSDESFVVTVNEGCFAEGKSIREILWPVSCRIGAIVRDGKEITAEGKTRLMAGDLLKIRSEQYDVENTAKQFEELLNADNGQRDKD